MLDAGVWVRCLDVKGGKVIVRQMEPPADVADIVPDAPPARDAGPLEEPGSPPATKRSELDDLDLGLDR
jgi:membrane-bound serine protease (ClpP class)